MKKILIFLLLVCLFPNHVKADYIVISEGEVLEGTHLHQKQSVASISKIMTAILAIEEGNLNELVRVDEETTAQVGSSLYLKENESFTLLSLVYGLMLRSGNDAAYLIAKTISNSQEAFVKMMNDKAKDLNMKNTTFSNPSGLDEFDEGNISTVYDMALCMNYAMKNEIFRLVVNTQQFKAEHSRVWVNKNRLLRVYDKCNGGKTGYTQQSGKTLITSANMNGFETIVVSFREPDYFSFHQRLHEEYFMKYERIVLIPKGKYKRMNQRIHFDEDVSILKKIGEEIQVEVINKKDELIIRYWQFDKMKEIRKRYL